MFERFTDRARHVLVLAQEEARLLNHSFIGTEHLLLGLLAEHDGVGARALAGLGVDREPVRKAVADLVGPINAVPSGSPPFTPRAKKVLELSLREALQMSHSYIGTEHLLLGLVREGEGVAAQVLVSMGADLGQVRQEVIALIGASSDPGDDVIAERQLSVARVGLAARHEEGRRLRADIEAALTSDPGVELLQRYAAGTLTEQELGDGSVTRALADALLRQHELLRRLAERLLSPPDDPGSRAPL